MTGRSVAVLIMFVLAFGLWVAPARGEAPTLEDLKNLSVTDPLGLAARAKVQEYVKHWVKKMAEAKKFQDVTKARKALTDGYEVHNTPPWWVAYAEISAANIPSILLLGDRVKQLQASMALALMPQYTIQPALEKMARHGNPGVRYWAVRGYRSSVKRMLLYPERTKKMLATLERLGRKESGPILAVVLRALNVYPDPGSDKNAIARLQGVLDKVWLARCADLRAGRSDVIEAYRKVIVFLEPFDKDDEKQKKQILQLLTDALKATSQGFDECKNQKGPAGQSWMDLLGDLEARLVGITSTGRTPVQDILSDAKKPVAQKAAEVRLKAVNEYWMPLLAKLGVKPRPVPVPKKKPVPTTTTAPAKT